MTLSLYVWYRIAGESAPARERVTRMQLELAEATGVAGRLLVRADDPRTFMEIYEDLDDAGAFERALEAAIAAEGVGELCDGPRHVERFRPSGDACG